MGRTHTTTMFNSIRIRAGIAVLCAAAIAGCGTANGQTTSSPAGGSSPSAAASGTAGETPMASTTPTAASTPAPTATPVACAADSGSAPAASQTEALIAKYTAAVKANALDHDSLLYLGLAYYQHARETADPTDYARADEAFNRLLTADPNDVEALIGSATIALARHQFADALVIGQKALALSPKTARVYGVVGDAQNELGLYDDAAASMETMVQTRPDLSSYSRISYVRELRGDLTGAISAMETAIRAGGPAPENTAYLRVILGNLQFTVGDLQKSDGAYRTTLQLSPGYVFALAGTSRVSAARGDLDQAIACYKLAAERVPYPEFLIAEGEAQQAAGRDADANKTYALVRQIEALFSANGVNTDLDLALFEAEHGDPATALTLAQTAYAATPNIKVADALGWALYQNGQLDAARQHAEEALRLGTRDPSYAYHAGMIAKAQGDTAQARIWLTQSLSANPVWSPLFAPRAQAALTELGGPVATP
jgi:tetratricopeptide (TPR) repeat protein